jgi:hypothetical protein
MFTGVSEKYVASSFRVENSLHWRKFYACRERHGGNRNPEETANYILTHSV